MTRILITGGCGFIGSNLVEYILENTNWNINVLDNLTSGKLKDLKQIKLFNQRVQFFKGDIRNKEDIYQAIKNCNFVVHLAAQTDVIHSIKNPFKDESVNIKGTLNLLDASIEKKIKRFILASSAAALGPQKMPLNESSQTEPISPYGVSKLAGEGYCRCFSETHDLNSTVVRFSNVYGPKSYHKGSVIAKFIKRIIDGKKIEVYGDGTQTRDFIHVYDICFGIYLSLIKNTRCYDIFQLGTGKETSINRLIEYIRELCQNNELEFPQVIYTTPRKGEVLRNYTDISKAKKLLNFSLQYSLKNGLKNTIEWFLNYYQN